MRYPPSCNKRRALTPRDFAEQHLFEPLGISNAKCGRPMPKEFPSAAGDCRSYAPRYGETGLIDLQNGEWDGQQIVSAAWVENATRTHANRAVMRLGYGYQWWTHPALAGYTALGRDGQTILVIPEADLVIVTTAKTEENIFELFDKYILPAVQKSQ